ncbi:MAG: hypothetical protein ACW97Z_08060 [Candidatus Hodarchaeales archaeon]|jgi:hypothetical protein
MTNLLQDPHIVIYDNLFFGLSLGKFDIIMITETYWTIEEFVIVRQVYKEGAAQLEAILPYYSGKASNMISRSDLRSFIENSGLFIQFINYSDLANRQLIGLGVRIISENKITLQAFGASSEDRIQKVMFLLSRGLLKSRFHRIEFEDIEIIM